MDCYLKLVGGEGGIQSYFKLVHQMQYMVSNYVIAISKLAGGLKYIIA